uniref:Uncharacterized protein n=1 Tax=Palpitomonas bilix TaxID=652834 RepID=A0A7S3DEZ1_9EUKA
MQSSHPHSHSHHHSHTRTHRHRSDEEDEDGVKHRYGLDESAASLSSRRFHLGGRLDGRGGGGIGSAADSFMSRASSTSLSRRASQVSNAYSHHDDDSDVMSGSGGEDGGEESRKLTLKEARAASAMAGVGDVVEAISLAKPEFGRNGGGRAATSLGMTSGLPGSLHAVPPPVLLPTSVTSRPLSRFDQAEENIRHFAAMMEYEEMVEKEAQHDLSRLTSSASLPLVLHRALPTLSAARFNQLRADPDFLFSTIPLCGECGKEVEKVVVMLTSSHDKVEKNGGVTSRRSAKRREGRGREGEKVEQRSSSGHSSYSRRHEPPASTFSALAVPDGGSGGERGGVMSGRQSVPAQMPVPPPSMTYTGSGRQGSGRGVKSRRSLSARPNLVSSSSSTAGGSGSGGGGGGGEGSGDTIGSSTLRSSYGEEERWRRGGGEGRRSVRKVTKNDIDRLYRGVSSLQRGGGVRREVEAKRRNKEFGSLYGDLKARDNSRNEIGEGEEGSGSDGSGGKYEKSRQEHASKKSSPPPFSVPPTSSSSQRGLISNRGGVSPASARAAYIRGGPTPRAEMYKRRGKVVGEEGEAGVMYRSGEKTPRRGRGRHMHAQQPLSPLASKESIQSAYSQPLVDMMYQKKVDNRGRRRRQTRRVEAGADGRGREGEKEKEEEREREVRGRTESTSSDSEGEGSDAVGAYTSRSGSSSGKDNTSKHGKGESSDEESEGGISDEVVDDIDDEVVVTATR